jgi:hypothetical protein
MSGTRYDQVLSAALANAVLEPGKVYLAEVRHDGTCPMPDRGPCTCSPSVAMREVRAEAP